MLQVSLITPTRILRYEYDCWGQIGVKMSIKKEAVHHYGSTLYKKTPEINDFRCIFVVRGQKR